MKQRLLTAQCFPAKERYTYFVTQHSAMSQTLEMF